MSVWKAEFQYCTWLTYSSCGRRGHKYWDGKRKIWRIMRVKVWFFIHSSHYFWSLEKQMPRGCKSYPPFGWFEGKINPLKFKVKVCSSSRTSRSFHFKNCWPAHISAPAYIASLVGFCGTGKEVSGLWCPNFALCVCVMPLLWCQGSSSSLKSANVSLPQVCK